jgi:hypothetical protein
MDYPGSPLNPIRWGPGIRQFGNLNYTPSFVAPDELQRAGQLAAGAPTRAVGQVNPMASMSIMGMMPGTDLPQGHYPRFGGGGGGGGGGGIAPVPPPSFSGDPRLAYSRLIPGRMAAPPPVRSNIRAWPAPFKYPRPGGWDNKFNVAANNRYLASLPRR